MNRQTNAAWSLPNGIVLPPYGYYARTRNTTSGVVEKDGVSQLDVKVGGFWRSEFRKLSVQWLPHGIRQMETGGRGEEMQNLVATAEINAGKKPSVKFKGCPWSDAYPFNTVESICLALEIDPGADAEWRKANDHLRAKLEEWIPIILAAQEPSGYIHVDHFMDCESDVTLGGKTYHMKMATRYPDAGRIDLSISPAPDFKVVVRYPDRAGSLETGLWYDVEITCRGDRVGVKMDGKTLFEPVAIPLGDFPSLE